MRAYREEGFPVTIVRPSLTYGDTQIPLAINSWTRSYTVVDRMRRGKKVIVPGDGTSLWVITHNTDFAKGLVGLLGREQAIGHAFHITSDEVMCWDQFYRIVAEAAGAEPNPVHMPSDFIAACVPDALGGLMRRQIRQRGLRQHQDQALRPGLLRHRAVHPGHPPHPRLVRRRPATPPDATTPPTPAGTSSSKPTNPPPKRPFGASTRPKILSRGHKSSSRSETCLDRALISPPR